MRIVFFDTETTGNGPQDRLCALAIKERGVEAPLLNAFFKPPAPISLESMAVHHITERRVADLPAFVAAPEYAGIKALLEDEGVVAVAHNAAFDIAMLAREGVRVAHPLCTFKIACALDQKGVIPSYQLQYLRHWMELEIDAPAHDALGDVLVLEPLFERQLAKYAERLGSEEVALGEMLAVSGRPALLSQFSFGKHKGRAVAEVAREAPDYLEWLLKQKRQNPLEEENWIYTLEHYLGQGRATS